MKVIEAPQDYLPRIDEISLFLAGGITGCPNWQRDVISAFSDVNASVVLLNPRRAAFPIGNPQAAGEQITWEHRHLRRASGILFWFPCETLCPIVLYELGAWSMTNVPIFLGVHPDYQRRQDVEIQTRLARPYVEIMFSLSDVVASVFRWIKE